MKFFSTDVIKFLTNVYNSFRVRAPTIKVVDPGIGQTNANAKIPL